MMWSQIRADIGSTSGRKPDPHSADARALLKLVHETSEDLWAAGWRSGLEFILWSAVEDDGQVPRAAEVPRALAEELAELSDRAGGWWVHCDDREWHEGDVPGRFFLTLADWRARYAGRPTNIT